MIARTDKPIVQRYNDGDCEFIYPPSIDNEKVNDTFWNAVELLDYEDAYAEKVLVRCSLKNSLLKI